MPRVISMTEENKFQKSLLKDKKNNENHDPSDFFNSDPVVPDDANIDERFRCLDEVTDHFYEEQLLGPNTHRSVLNTAELAKKGQINLSKAGKTSPKGKSKGI